MTTSLHFRQRRLACALAVVLPLELLAASRRPAAAAPLLLVSPEEVRRYAAPEAGVMERTLPRQTPEVPPGPRIDLLRPTLDVQLRLKSPFPIEVRFVPLPDAAVDPASFRVLYGNLRLDVTSRILDKVRVAATGFSLAEAAIPPGSHRLLLRVGDVRQRTGELDLRFEVD
jgi:hypothetical protein